ncbi:MAG: redox-sensing transcriptional repressor Rex [Pirellula sp.]|jgi:redox-sensing transcriptional repressor|nr:redox-sensing transcriptional repressor Rex [Pirellula sp.]
MTFSEATISRLPLYLRELLQIQRHGEQRVQSGVLAKRLGLNASQVRRDLSGFGSMGQRGVGYEVRGLIQTIQQVLGSDRSWNVILVGVGNLGRALSGYRGFAQQGFRLVGAFDIDPSKIGEKLGSLTVLPLSDLEEFVRAEGVELAMIAVPAGVVTEVTERLEMAGVTGILNFAPVMVRRSASPVTVVNVDLAIELQRLAFLVLQSRDDSES